jgi:hypothetical protein
MLNDVIGALYYHICFYILITIDDVILCMYCGVNVGAPSLLLKLGVTPRLRCCSGTQACNVSLLIRVTLIAPDVEALHK